VSLTRSAAFGEGTAVEVDPAELPSIGVLLRVEKDREMSYQDVGRHYFPDPTDADRFLQYEGLRTYVLTMDLLMAGRGSGEAITLFERVQDSLAIQPWLYGPANTVVWPTRTYEEYPIEILQEPQEGAGENTWDLASYLMTVQVLGVRAMPDSPREKIWKIEKAKLCDRANGYAEWVIQ